MDERTNTLSTAPVALRYLKGHINTARTRRPHYMSKLTNPCDFVGRFLISLDSRSVARLHLKSVSHEPNCNCSQTEAVALLWSSLPTFKLSLRKSFVIATELFNNCDTTAGGNVLNKADIFPGVVVIYSLGRIEDQHGQQRIRTDARSFERAIDAEGSR